MPDYNQPPWNFSELFEQGADRDLPHFKMVNGDLPVLNLGAGNKKIGGTIALDWPEWDAEKDPIPYETESVGGIIAYHFLEHLRDPRPVLRECSRVLAPQGVLNIVVPHVMGVMAFQDLDHKSFWTSETWKELFNNPYYEKDHNGFDFRIGINVIMGLNERNLMLVSQLIKN